MVTAAIPECQKLARFWPYTGSMARGWESKSVEAQQEEAVASDGNKRGQLSPEQLAARRRRDELTLMRKKVEHDLVAAGKPPHRPKPEPGARGPGFQLE